MLPKLKSINFQLKFIILIIDLTLKAKIEK